MSNLNEVDQVAIGFIVLGGLTILYIIYNGVYECNLFKKQPLQSEESSDTDIIEEV